MTVDRHATGTSLFCRGVVTRDCQWNATVLLSFSMSINGCTKRNRERTQYRDMDGYESLLLVLSFLASCTCLVSDRHGLGTASVRSWNESVASGTRSFIVVNDYLHYYYKTGQSSFRAISVPIASSYADTYDQILPRTWGIHVNHPWLCPSSSLSLIHNFRTLSSFLYRLPSRTCLANFPWKGSVMMGIALR